MNYLLEHINQDIKGDKAKIRTQKFIRLNTRAKEIQQVDLNGPDIAKASGPSHLIYR